MILTDYFYSAPDISWDFARQCGVEHGVIRLPETDDFDPASEAHWRAVYDRFTARGIRPIVVEPMPNALHDHIKAGDARRDECIDKVIRMLAVMDRLNVRTICFNFMAHVGWTRTSKCLPERGGARVTGFDLREYEPGGAAITADALWANYEYFVRAVAPHAEKHGVRLALHPDDPPLKLGNVERIMTSYANIRRALSIRPSAMLGVTMCQASYRMMGEDLYEVIPALGEKIFFIHFRNVTGEKTCFRETFHDNGDIDMADMIRLYAKYCPDAPIRVDHVPEMAGEDSGRPGYGNLGRLFAIGYLKGLIEGCKA